MYVNLIVRMTNGQLAGKETETLWWELRTKRFGSLATNLGQHTDDDGQQDHYEEVKSLKPNSEGGSKILIISQL